MDEFVPPDEAARILKELGCSPADPAAMTGRGAYRNAADWTLRSGEVITVPHFPGDRYVSRADLSRICAYIRAANKLNHNHG